MQYMAGKKIHLAAALIGLALISGGAWWYQNKTDPAGAASPGATDPAARPGTGVASNKGGPSGPGSGGPRGPGGPAAVEVARVEMVRLEDDSQAVGSLRARQGVVLKPEVSGRIQVLSFGDGQRIQKGQLMVQLDDTLQQAQLKQAEASAAIARTNLQRSRELAAQNFVSQSAVDQNAAALEVAQAQVALAQAQLSRMKILAPFDGITGIRSVSVGDYVKDGADLVMIEDVSSLWVDFRLPERYLGRLRTGQSVEVVLDAVADRKFKAQIEAIDAQLDANGRSVLVRARMANGDGRLRGGMFARVRAVFDVRDKALIVPEEALVPLGNRQVVFKVVDGPNGGKVAQRADVKIGMRVPGKVEILDGLAAGESVVVAGQSRLMRGENPAVRVVDLNRPRGPGGPGGARPGAAASAPSGGPASRPAGPPSKT
jgi:membrane fusion protein (multidrug efflux system)